jgi:hypothetical protein
MPRTSPTSRKEELPTLSLEGQLVWRTDEVYIDVNFDRIALAGNVIAVLSCVGSTPQVKALRACFGASLKNDIELFGRGGERGIHLSHGADKVWECNAWGFSGGYTVQAFRLGKDTVHALFLAKSPGLLLNSSEECLWKELKHERFETPLLRSWVPYLREQLISHGKLHPCKCVGCDVWGLSCRTKDLDELVIDGIKMGAIKIEEPA